MPVSKKKQAEVQTRRERVAILYMLGISMTSINTLIGSKSAAHNDVKWMQDQDFSQRPNPQKKGEVVAAVLRFLAAHREGSNATERREYAELDVAYILSKKYGPIRELRAMLHSMRSMQKLLEKSGVCFVRPHRVERYECLIRDVLGVDNDPTVSHGWMDFLQDIESGDVQLPKTFEGITSRLTAWATSKMDRAQIRVPFDPDALMTAVDAVLWKLRPRERQVIRLRYGLDVYRWYGRHIEEGCPMTLEEVGQDLFVTAQRVRQIQNETLEKLRHPSKIQQLLPFFTRRVHDLQRQVQELEERLEQNRRAQEVCEKEGAIQLPEYLFRPINTLDLNIRARNCLENMDIHWIGELVQCDDLALLKVKSFGRKTLKEVRATLANLGQPPWSYLGNKIPIELLEQVLPLYGLTLQAEYVHVRGPSNFEVRRWKRVGE